MDPRRLRLPALLAAALVPGLLEAHARLLSPVPRRVETLKVGPCGGDPRTGKTLILYAGQELEVVWEEYIDHPGYYQILFSPAADRNFVMLLDQIPDRRIPTGSQFIEYSAVVTLPSTPCAEGTLQLIQVMTENPQAPQLYFSCADIRLVDRAVPELRRGDANADGKVDLSDAVATLLRLFLGGEEAPCKAAVDSNADGALDVSDAIHLLEWLYRSGPALPAPGPQRCGPLPAEDPLGCESHPPCQPAG